MTPKLKSRKVKELTSTVWSGTLPYYLGSARKSMNGWKLRYRAGMRAWRRGRAKPT